ncbi:DUF11 domain-containing protein [candidate division KSB1 bacterium]|nr:DUF11 domain-containing protein [candidate division KSB1 bacterium]
MKSLRNIWIIGLLLISASLYAQGQPKLEIEIQDRKVNMTAEETSGADVVYAPSDTIEYVILAKNTGDGVMTDPEIVDPIPQGVQYIAESAAGENCRILFSVNQGIRYSEWPVRLPASGDQNARDTRPGEITHIKWMIRESIPADSQKTLSFKVVVE